jgi:Rieske Fe-S protein
MTQDLPPADSLSPADEDPTLDRRGVLKGAAALGVLGLAGSALAACATKSATEPTSSAATTPGGTAGPGVTIAASAIPEGGGKVVGAYVVVKTGGTVKAYSSVCTHQGCTVGSVANDVITCPCHGSEFSSSDGAVVRGPARTPLPAATATVQGDTVTVTTA